MAIHPGILAWEIPWTEKPGRLQSVRSQRVRHDLVTEMSIHETIIKSDRTELTQARLRQETVENLHHR